MTKYLSLISISLFTLIFSYNVTAQEEFTVPDLPKLNLDEIKNERDASEEKARGPSNSNSQSNLDYEKPTKEVQGWDYQTIIDRHDKH